MEEAKRPAVERRLYMKEPRFQLTIEATLDEYLGLLWELQGRMNVKADKQTVRKIAAFEKQFVSAHRAWKKEHFKCAGKL